MQHPDKIAGPVLAVELLPEYAVPSGATGTCGTRHAKYDGIVGEATQSPGLDGGRSDFCVGKLPEQLTEALDMFVKQGRHCLLYTSDAADE